MMVPPGRFFRFQGTSRIVPPLLLLAMIPVGFPASITTFIFGSAAPPPRPPHSSGVPMNLHEYQAKELFARFGIPVLPGQVAATPEEARDVAASIGGTVVVKAQVQVGGRGKAGGVKLAHDAGRGRREGARHPRAHDQGPAGAQGAGRAGGRHRARDVRWRSCSTARRSCRSSCCRPRAASTSRRSRAHEARDDRAAGIDAARRPARLPGARADAAAAPGSARRSQQAADILIKLYGAFLRRRLLARRDQPARRHHRRARCWRSTPRCRSTTTRVFRHRDWEALRDPDDETAGRAARRARRASRT